MNKKEAAVGLACHIAFEWVGWGEEHVSDMLQTYSDCGDKPPCSGDELSDLCLAAESHKQAGKTYQETENLMLKTKKG